MTKRSGFFATALVFIGLMVVFFVCSWKWGKGLRSESGAVTEQEIADVRKRLGLQPATQMAAVQVAIPINRPIRIALGGLGLGGNLDGEVDDLAVAKLSGVAGVQMVEREALEAILRELQFSLGGFVRASDAVRAGKLVHADWFVFGSTYSVNGDRTVVLRIVDSKSGILLEVGSIRGERSAEALASNVAAIVKKARQRASDAKAPVYLALGGFEDVSVNNRLANFQTQLRAYLTAAYRNSCVTLVDREFIDMLLQEITLDQAGLAEKGSTEASVQLQPAFWLVEGTYQSYETDRKEVELKIRVDRVFGLSKEDTFRLPTGKRLFGAIKEFIDKTMESESGGIVWTQRNEARWQMDMGRRLAHAHGTDPLTWAWVNYLGDQAMVARNVEEATHCFEAALLLEPTNRAAKYYLASCLETAWIGRTKEAKEYFRAIIEEGKADPWARWSQLSLGHPGLWEDKKERARWNANAERTATNAEAASYFHSQAEYEGAYASEQDHDEKAKNILYSEIRAHGNEKNYGGDWGIYAYLHSFGDENRSNALSKLAWLLPEIKTNFPKSYPAVLAWAVTFQSESNNTVVAEFQRTLESSGEINGKTVSGADYLSGLYWDDRWAVAHSNYVLGVEVLMHQKNAQSRLARFDSDQKMNLAYGLEKLGRWRQALDIFETYSNHPVVMGNAGFYGTGLNLVFPHSHCRLCREKLGLPEARDPREFKLVKAGIPLRGFAFTTDEHGLWVGQGSRLLRLGFDTSTNEILELPCYSTVRCLAATADAIWIGTDGGGLIRFDRKSKTSRQWTGKNGLLMNSINCLCVQGDTVWLGYGQKEWDGVGVFLGVKGGLGKIDAKTFQVETFGKSILGEDAAPDRAAYAVVAPTPDDVWLAIGGGLHHFDVREKVWKTVPRKVSDAVSVAATTDTVFVSPHPMGSASDWDTQLSRGKRATYPPLLRALDANDDACRQSQLSGPLAGQGSQSVYVIGTDLWVGGLGYIARLDPKTLEVCNFAYVNSPEVDSLSIGGGYVWGRARGGIFRAPLPQ